MNSINDWFALIYWSIAITGFTVIWITLWHFANIDNERLLFCQEEGFVYESPSLSRIDNYVGCMNITEDGEVSNRYVPRPSEENNWQKLLLK
jgi:hypothetical protein